jgi:2-methylcitrate dehydratase PrpD
MVRMGLSAGKTHHSQRWLLTTTVGAPGAAAAAGILLGLDETEMTYALAIAGANTGGLSEVLGTMSKGYNAGHGAMSGVIAALLAKRGFTSAEDILTGKFGFHAVFQSDQNVQVLTSELGSDWKILNAGLKPFACGSGLRALLGGVLALRERHSSASTMPPRQRSSMAMRACLSSPTNA